MSFASASSSGSSDALQPGARIGPYRVTGWIGRGGMGQVYQAHDEAAGRLVALKVLAPEVSHDARFVERFRREIQLASNIHHPHIVACFGAGEIAGRLWLALELVPGGTLSARVHTGPLPWREAARFGAEIASALAALHGIGIVHRDLKPANVLLTADGVSKLSDLGVARSDSLTALTRTGELVGTVEYMAPELADGARSADARADLYSLGCTLYCLLAGEPPFPGSGPDTIAKHIRSVPPPLASRAPDCPPAVAKIVHQLLAKEPAERGDDAASVVRAFERALGGKPVTGKLSDQKPLIAARLLLALVGVVVAGALIFVIGRPTPAPTPAASPVARPMPSPSPVVRPSPSVPPWFTALEADKKPRSLPTGVRVGEAPGEYVHLRDGSVLVYVPEATFVIGRPPGSDVPEDAYKDELPNCKVYLSGYFIGKYEVSNDEFTRFVTATHYVTTAERKGHGKVLHIEIDQPTTFQYNNTESATWRSPRGKGPNPLDYPVVQVSWDDAASYTIWAGLRLPSEAEWERAAAWDGDKARIYPWGNDADPAGRANVVGMLADGRGEDGLPNHLDPVKSNREGASPVGAFNMIGNATEWCIDYYDPHIYRHYKDIKKEGDRIRNPCVIKADDNTKHTLRGASFLHASPATRAANRMKPDNSQHDGTGFRVALSGAGETREWEDKIAGLIKR